MFLQAGAHKFSVLSILTAACCVLGAQAARLLRVIPQSNQEKLFKPFYEIDSTTTREYGGTGLGLAISNQLADVMGGSTGIESQEGAGSTFSLSARFLIQSSNSESDVA